MNRQEIDREARRLHYEIWHKRKRLFPMGEPSSIAVCSPDVAARMLEIQYEYRDNLGQFRAGKALYEVAGILNRKRGIISVSTHFSDAAIRFTGAHETGHFLLHPGEVFHRDRPVSYVHAEKRSNRKHEADYFAACFFASEKLIRQEYEPRSGRVPLCLNDTVAYHLAKSACRACCALLPDRLYSPRRWQARGHSPEKALCRSRIALECPSPRWRFVCKSWGWSMTDLRADFAKGPSFCRVPRRFVFAVSAKRNVAMLGSADYKLSACEVATALNGTGDGDRQIT